MEQKELIARISEKVSRLGEEKLKLKQEANRLIQDNERLYAINKGLQSQVDELLATNKDLKLKQSLTAGTGETTQQARQRINELVKEIDECISLLNQ